MGLSRSSSAHRTSSRTKLGFKHLPQSRLWKLSTLEFSVEACRAGCALHRSCVQWPKPRGDGWILPDRYRSESFAVCQIDRSPCPAISIERLRSRLRIVGDAINFNLHPRLNKRAHYRLFSSELVRQNTKHKHHSSRQNLRLPKERPST